MSTEVGVGLVVFKSEGVGARLRDSPRAKCILTLFSVPSWGIFTFFTVKVGELEGTGRAFSSVGARVEVDEVGDCVGIEVDFSCVGWQVRCKEGAKVKCSDGANVFAEREAGVGANVLEEREAGVGFNVFSIDTVPPSDDTDSKLSTFVVSDKSEESLTLIAAASSVGWRETGEVHVGLQLFEGEWVGIEVGELVSVGWQLT